MTAGTTWGILAIAALFLWLGASLLRTYLQWHAGVKIREMLYKERMAALSKGVALPPDSSPSISVPSGFVSLGMNRLISAPASKVLSLFGIVLLSLGVGFVWALRESDIAEWGTVWSIGIIPGCLGLGLILYSLFVKKIP